MTPFIGNSRASKTNPYWHKADQWLPGAGGGENVIVKGVLR